MSQLKEVTYDAINSFIIAIKCGSAEDIKKYLDEYDPEIVNRLESQTRQPSLYFSAILIDHEMSYGIMKMLIQHGANAHFKDNYQQTIMFYACREGKEKCLDLLLEQGLSVDDQDIYGQTPLYYATKENRLNIIHTLLARKVDVNHCDKICDQSPIFYAARQGHLEMCKILVGSGANIAHQDSQHKMAAHYAKRAGMIQVFDYLTAEYQSLKEQKKLMPDNRTESNHEQKIRLKKKKDSLLASQTPQIKTIYRLYRADNLGNSTGMSQQEYDQFIASYPALEEMFRNPQEIDLTEIDQVRNQNAWVRYASKALTICSKAKGGYFFHQPVDPVRFNIDDYFEIIREPMDFGTIRRKLNLNVYETVQEFMIDMNLVFDNCVKYNGSDNQVAKYALEIKGAFEENMRSAGYTI